MVIQCTSMGCYVEKSSGNYVPEVDQNEEVWEKEKGAAGKGELFVPIRPSKQDEEEDVEKENPIKKDIEAFIEDIEKADLGKYDTFQGKVNALVKEGYPEENAKKIVGAFVKGEKKKEADGGTVMSTDAGVNNPVYNSKDEKKRKEDDDDETDKDHSNSDGESHSMFNQDVGFDRKKNYFGGIRENYDGTIKQGGMEEEETNEIHIHRENQEDEDKYDKEKEKKEKTRDLVTINQSLQKHEKTMFLKSLHTCIEKHGKYGVSTCPHCGTRAMGVRNWAESPKNQKYNKPLKEKKQGTQKQEKLWEAQRNQAKLDADVKTRDINERRIVPS